MRDLILKLTSETSFASASRRSEMRTLTVCEMEFGTGQRKEPLLDVVPAMTVAVVKPSVEYSSFTSGTVPVCVHVIDSWLSTVHCSAMLGLVSVKPAMILKGLFERSFASGSFGSDTRTLMSLV